MDRNNLFNSLNLDEKMIGNNNYNGPIQNSLLGSNLQNAFNFKQKDNEINAKKSTFLKKKAEN